MKNTKDLKDVFSAVLLALFAFSALLICLISFIFVKVHILL